MITSQGDFDRVRAACLRAYERGRVRMALTHAVTFCLVSGGLSLLFVGMKSWVWLPLTLAAWGAVEWRGAGLLRGGRVGALAGAVTVMLPLSILRRCCKPGALEMMGADCCSMPGACAAAGVVVGLVLACFLPDPFGVRGPETQLDHRSIIHRESRGETVLGMLLGIAAVAPMKCSALLLGEAAGLVGGLVAGVLAAGAARAVLRRWIARA
jgi:hypothetical protein